MNIVFVTQALPYLPARDGFRLYAANLLRSLARHHDIDLASLLREGESDHLTWARDHCKTLLTLRTKTNRDLLTPINLFATYAWGKPLQHRRTISSFLTGGSRSRRWDVLHVEGGYAGGLVPSDLILPRVLSVHDSWKLRCAEMAKCSPTRRERLYHTLVSQIEPRYERLVFPRFDSCVVVGETDARAIRSVAPSSQVVVIPMGIDTEYYRPMSVKTDGASFVFHGNLEYAPNIQAAMEFARLIFPLIRRHAPQAVFRLVGAKPAKEIREIASWPGVRLSADLPDLRNTLCSSSVYVCPLRYGTGVKNKLLEAMALALPIISYPEGVNGIDCIPEKHLLLADDPQEFARLALDLLNNPPHAQELGRAARQFVEENFSWESRARSFERLYLQAIENRSRQSNLRNPFPHSMRGQTLVTSEAVPRGLRNS
jgi:polysaccharide biosynthesis protein PslH